jgi:hypothetical protein
MRVMWFYIHFVLQDRKDVAPPALGAIAHSYVHNPAPRETRPASTRQSAAGDRLDESSIVTLFGWATPPLPSW